MLVFANKNTLFFAFYGNKKNHHCYLIFKPCFLTNDTAKLKITLKKNNDTGTTYNNTFPQH